MAFDLLRLHGTELDRPALAGPPGQLDELELDGSGWSVPPVYDDGPALLAATRGQGLEGTVAKRISSAYQAGRRSRDWVKTPNRQHQACVVGGWRQQTGTSSAAIGALLVGIPGPDRTSATPAGSAAA